MKAAVIVVALVVIVAASLLATGHKTAATATAIGGSLVIALWRKVLGKIGIRSSR